MPRSRLERIREKIRLQQYDMTVHAVEEMAEDNLDITDVEHAVLTGRIARIERDNPRGNKYCDRGSRYGRSDRSRGGRPLYWQRPISDHYRL